jgi:hypothetical protein
MESIHPSIIVFVTLTIVAVAAVAYQPSGYLGQWRKLSDRYETDRRPGRITYRGQHILVGRLFGSWIFWRYDLGEFAKFDVEVDDDGIWFLYDGPLPKKCPPCLFVPGKNVTYLRDKRNQFFFHIDAVNPVEITTRRELGEAIKRRGQMTSDDALH